MIENRSGRSRALKVMRERKQNRVSRRWCAATHHGLLSGYYSDGITCLCLETIALYEKAGAEPNQAVAIQSF